MASAPASLQRLVLVGGGHSHVEVLRQWARDPAPGARLFVVTDGPRSVYSGMVPGFVAGQYRRDAIEIDVERLARRAGAEWVDGRATGVDTQSRRLHLGGAPPLAYDTVSFDVGATVSGLDLPGVRQYGLPTRPIGDFVERLDALIERLRRGPQARLVVVGAGAGGVELAFAFRARFGQSAGRAPAVTLVEMGPRILPGYPDRAARLVERAARRLDVEIRCNCAVAAAHAEGIALEGGASLPCDAMVWVAGSAGSPLFDDAGVERDERGFVKVRATLQAVGHDELFASGDCASLLADPTLPKAGVHAVRQGPLLAANLRAHLIGRPLRAFRPRRAFLSLLNLGDGTAVAARGRLAAEGAWAWRLKDAIDRRFVRRYA